MRPSNKAEMKKMSRVPYTLAVGSLMVAMIFTRPDIAQEIGAVSQYMANPGGEHCEIQECNPKGGVNWVSKNYSNY